MERKLFNRRDGLPILALLALALALYLYGAAMNRGGAVMAEITVDGAVTRRVSLAEDKIFALEENPHIRFEVRDGAIAFIESDCPDKVCVHTGFINRPGQIAVCLPNRVSVAVVGESDVDIIAQ